MAGKKIENHRRQLLFDPTRSLCYRRTPRESPWRWWSSGRPRGTELSTDLRSNPSKKFVTPNRRCPFNSAGPRLPAASGRRTSSNPRPPSPPPIRSSLPIDTRHGRNPQSSMPSASEPIPSVYGVCNISVSFCVSFRSISISLSIGSRRPFSPLQASPKKRSQFPVPWMKRRIWGRIRSKSLGPEV